MSNFWLSYLDNLNMQLPDAPFFLLPCAHVLTCSPCADCRPSQTHQTHTHTHTNKQVLRLANNSLTGGIPTSATTSTGLFLLDLHSNKLAGSLPENWASPALQMLMLDDNKLTGVLLRL